MHRIARPFLAAFAALAFASIAAAQQKSEEETFKLMKSEKIGDLRYGMTEAEVKQAVPGQPVRGREQRWEADGLYHQAWTFAARGLKLSLAAEKKGGAKTLESVHCTGKCLLKTSRGIGIGSPLADVQKTYAAEFNKEESKPDQFVAGTIYGGLILNLKAGKVSAMFLGAAAE